MRCGARGAGREAGGCGAGAAQAACMGRARLKAGEQSTCEGRRALPRVERRAYYGAGRAAGREAEDGGRRRCRGGLVCRLGVGHGEERTANIILYILVTPDVSMTLYKRTVPQLRPGDGQRDGDFLWPRGEANRGRCADRVLAPGEWCRWRQLLLMYLYYRANALGIT